MLSVQKTLDELKGRKLLTAWYDPEQGMHYLLFEGMQAIAVEAIMPVANARDVVDSTLAQNLDQAERMIELKRIVEAAAPPAPVFAAGVEIVREAKAELTPEPDGVVGESEEDDDGSDA